jgi:hypothetical protein
MDLRKKLQNLNRKKSNLILSNHFQIIIIDIKFKKLQIIKV